MSRQPLRRIVIAGGGTAGWMTAALLGRFMAQMPTDIVLVESEEIGTIGVGEATLPLIEIFNRLIGLDEGEFLRATHGSYKLAIRFDDWGQKGDSYYHPFAAYGQNFGVADFHHSWLRLRATGDTPPLSAYNLGTQMAMRDRFGGRSTDPRSPLSGLSYAYHFDAGLYAQLLRRHAEAHGVTRFEGRIDSVGQDPQTGFITTLRLQNGTEIAGDLFVDCTGFRALLIEQTLKTGYIDWNGLLPCDRAVAVPSARTEPLTPYTRATARDAGWQWRIPLQHRTGNGYVYSSGHISDDEATHTVLGHLDGEALAEPRIVRFRTGRRAEAWTKNVVAIGLSAGFLEPLESTSIHLIQKGAQKLLQCLPDLGMSPELREEFNRQTAFDYDDVRDFLCLHYKLTLRDDTAFWRFNRDNTVSASLADRMALFADTGRVFVRETELFKMGSWLSVLLGQGLTPRSYDPMADAVPETDLRRALEGMRAGMAGLAAQQPDHATYLSRP